MDNDSVNLYNIMDTIENDCKVKKVKESVLLLKRKMCKTHDLIKQYTENKKEINRLKSDLEVAKKEAKHMISNYKFAMDKIRELELKNVEDKQGNGKLTDKINEYEINMAADKQTIQQLTCKIKDLGEEQSAKIIEYDLQKSFFEDKIKDLEHELKKSKAISMHKKRGKKIISTDFDTANPSIGTKSSSDIGINVSLCDNVSNAKHVQVQDKSIMTDDFYNMKDFDTAEPSIGTKSRDIGINVSLCDNVSNAKHVQVQDKSIMTDDFYNMKDFDTAEPSIGTKSRDIGINVSLCDNVPNAKHVQVRDKNIMTDEFYNMKDDPHPLFCAKCEAHLSPDLTPEKICKTMSTYPKLIERDLFPLPKNIYSPPCSFRGTYPDSTNRNEDVLSRISSMTRMSPYSQYSDSIVGNPKSQSGRQSAMTQISESVEIKNMDISHISVAANLPRDLNPIPTEFISSENRNRARQDFCSDDLLAKHSLSIEEIEGKIRLLECKMKKFRRLKEKMDTNPCCRCSTNYNDGISLNPNLISIICEGMAKYYDGRREACSRNERNIDSEKCKCSTKKVKLKNRQRSSNCNENENSLSWGVENLDENLDLQDTLCKKTTKSIDILQSEHISNVHKNHSSNASLNETDESDKRELFPNEENTLHSAEVTSVEDSLMTDEIYVGNNFLSKDNVEAIDVDNQTETGRIVLSKDENTIDYADRKIVINVEENKIKKKSQNIHKVADRLFKNIRSLKRKTQAKSRVNKQENIESCSEHSSEHNELAKKLRVENREETGDRPLENIRNLKRKLETHVAQTESSINKPEEIGSSSGYYKPAKKLRIAHTPKTLSVPQCKLNENDFTHRTIKSIAGLEMTRRKGNGNQQLGTHTRKDSLLTESENSTINKKCNEKMDAAKCIDRRPINEEDLDSTSPEDSLEANNITLSAVNVERVSEKSDKVSIEDTINVNENDFTHRTVKSIAGLEMTRRKDNGNQQLGTHTRKDSLLTESENSYTINKKCNEKMDAAKCIDRRPINEEDLDSTSPEDSPEANNITLSAVNVERVSEKSNDALIEDRINASTSVDRTMGEASQTNNDEPNMSDNNIPQDTPDDLELEESIPLRTCVITQSEPSALYKDDHPKCDKPTEASERIETRKGTTPTAQLEYAYQVENTNDGNEAISKNDESDLSTGLEATRHENHNRADDTTQVLYSSASPRFHSTVVEDCTNDNNVKESPNEMKNAISKPKKACVNNEATGIRENSGGSKKRGKNTKLIDISHDVEESPAMSRIMKYINKKCEKNPKLPYKKMKYVSKIADMFVKKQLQRLINSAWEDSVHHDVIEKLASTCGPRIIAKGIVEFLSKEIRHSEALNNSFTPPAPLMTTFEQKITALLIDLEVPKPTVIYFVQAAIEYNLFRLNSDVKSQVDMLTRMYVVLSRIQKDREKVRMMCCNALYCMGLRSIGVLYTIITSWAEVLPNADANTGILPKCIAFLIGSQQVENTGVGDLARSLKKLKTLKTQISMFYNYTYTQETTSDIVKELMTALRAKRISGLDTAIILVAKREGSSWTYKNIIQSVLLPMIIKSEHPCVYSAFSLLGRLLRTSPLEDKDNKVQEISEQLCDLIESGQGSHDQQEGILSALLSLSRHKFKLIAPFIIKWTPSQSLRPNTDVQFQAFINTRNLKFWKNFLEGKHIESIPSKT